MRRACDLVTGRQARFEGHERLRHPGGRDPGQHRIQAVRSLGMVPAGVVVGKGIVPAEQDGHRNDGTAPGAARHRPVRWIIVRARISCTARQAPLARTSEPPAATTCTAPAGVDPSRTAIAALLAVAVLGGVEPASLAAPAAAETALVLDSQSPAFVSTQAGVTLRVGVNSALPATRLPLEVTLYSAILDRYTLRQTLTGSLTRACSPHSATPV